MKFGNPWTVKGIRLDARMTAREAARRSGMSVGDWLNSAIFEQAEDNFHEYDEYENNSRDHALTLIRQQLDQLEGRFDDILVKESGHAPARYNDNPRRMSELIDRLEERFEELSKSKNSAQRNIGPSVEPSPAFDHASEAAVIPTQPSSNHDLSALKDHLGRIADQLEAMRDPALETINTLRNELEGMRRALNETLPRQVIEAQAVEAQAIEAIERRIEKLHECVTDGRQSQSQNAALNRIESSLTNIVRTLQDVTPASLQQVDHEVAAIREMIAHVASRESVKDLAVQMHDLSDKINQIPRLCAAQVSAGARVQGVPHLHPENVPEHDSRSDDALPSERASAEFIAAARRATRTPLREIDVNSPLINANGRSDDRGATPLRPSRLRKGIKFFLGAASILIVLIGSLQAIDYGTIRGFTARILGSVIMSTVSDMAVNQDRPKTDPVVERPTAPDLPPQKLTQGASLQDESQEQTRTFAPALLPASGNLFNTMAPSNAMRLIHGTPLLFAPPVSTPTSKPQSNVGGMESASTAKSARISAPADELPSAIGGEHLRKAAMTGDPAAAYSVAQRYAEGRGVGINLEEAARWYKRAADQGFVPAQFRYAVMLEKGQGLTKDLGQARQFYLTAAAKGHAKSMHNLAVLYAQGIDGKSDYNNAVVWFREAANYGIVDSQYNLAVLMERGFGIETNLSEAYKWFALAAAQGDQEAGKKRDEIAGKLTSQQLTVAQESVKGFKAKPQPEQALVIPNPAAEGDGVVESKQSANTPVALNTFKIGAR